MILPIDDNNVLDRSNSLVMCRTAPITTTLISLPENDIYIYNKVELEFNGKGTNKKEKRKKK